MINPRRALSQEIKTCQQVIDDKRDSGGGGGSRTIQGIDNT
jgi:hypothetical protein